jgi:hypothetical protein
MLPNAGARQPVKSMPFLRIGRIWPAPGTFSAPGPNAQSRTCAAGRAIIVLSTLLNGL